MSGDAALPLGYQLRPTDAGLTLIDPEGREIRPDWAQLDIRSGPGRSQKAPLFRAIASKHQRLAGLTLLDTTAGWGEDTLLLLAAGCRVIACERHPVIAQLLADAARRFAATDRIPDLDKRLTLLHVDACELLTGVITPTPLWGSDPDPVTGIDAALIDPMFPAERKAGERQAMKSLRAVVGDADTDDHRLLEAALEACVPRVAVKRPRRAACLGGRTPHHAVVGRGFRFDVYLNLGVA
ncbi:class I SAM-dependent methyltransferase [Mucisphaera calidilacus]|uniref:Ribosomal RNA small subunit methyltransferase J n=1 Tax=Mucisphaera calidilacus TaxID=2527982 RepID=A0A518BUW4_9BACT|nr:class I SAM-dependent methyltransferase [Mucisphaera calidilacus]QDU70724.1 Ribosomal RNA small subunit methyltransferase J [Mucisphaera calidilacus]